MTESEIIVQISNNQQKIDLLVADRKKLLCQIEELDALKGKYRALECRIQENFYVGSLRFSRYAESTVKNRTLQKYNAGNVQYVKFTKIDSWIGICTNGHSKKADAIG